MASPDQPTPLRPLHLARTRIRRRQTQTQTQTGEKPLAHPSLSPEIASHIISFASDDLQTLHNISLVCNSWNAISKPHIFHTITLETKRSHSRFQDLLENSPHICDIVRKLQIHGPLKKETGHKTKHIGESEGWLSVLPGKLKKLETLEIVRLRGLWWFGFDEKLAKLTSVTKLAVIDCIFPVSALFDITSALPSLKELVVNNFRDTFNWGVVGSSLHEPRVEKLTLLGEEIPSIRDPRKRLTTFLTEHGRGTSLRTVNISVSARNLKGVASFLAGLGSQLQELEISFFDRFGWEFQDLPSIIRELDLSRNTGLKSLTLPDPAHPMTRPILIQISSTKIRTVTFKFLIRGVQSVRKAGPKELTKILFGWNLVSLREVWFVYDYRGEKLKRLEEEFRKAYAGLEKKGMLRLKKSQIGS